MASLRWITIAAAVTAVQASGWEPNQVNTTMCKLRSPRVAVIKDTAYIDGGYLYWQAGMNDGSVAGPEPDDLTSGIIYTLNFSVPFKFSDNITAILGADLTKGAGGGSLNNLFPTYVDGALLANDHQFIDYGGLTAYKDAYQTDPPDELLIYQESWYGAEDKAFKQGFLPKKLENGTNRYVTSGGAVSVPSENKGYYFSGVKNVGGGPVYAISGEETEDPNALSNTLITVDMTRQQEEKFTNDTLPEDIGARAGAELAFIPVGEEGILVAIGGVTESIWDYEELDVNQTSNSFAKSPDFVYRVAVYDIKNKKWYSQITGSAPSKAMAQGCTVVASASDGSSHNIYWYGGTDGLKRDQPYYDSVWALSLPSFEWKQIAQGDDAKHGRSGHRCVKPYPDQMLVIGGETPAQGTTLSCLADTDGKKGGGFIQGFNLSSGQWMSEYDPRKWSEYQVPNVIYATVGGNAQGGATKLGPEKWDDSGLEAVFATNYDTSKIVNHYPYAVREPGENTTRPNVDPAPSAAARGGGGTPKWLAPVLGTVLGLIFISALIVAILLFRRRRYFRSNHSVTDNTSDANRGRILSWVKGSHGPDPKSPTTLSATASDYNNSGTDLTSSAGRTRAFSATSQGSTVGGRAMSPLGHEVDAVEADGEVIHEMADTSAIQELADSKTGLTYMAAPVASKSGLARNQSVQSSSTDGNLLSPSTDGSGTSNTNQTGTGTWDAQSSLVSPSTPRPDSPTEGSSGIFGQRGSNPFKKSERSEMSKSSDPEKNAGWGGGGTHMSISPPTPKREESDYLSAAPRSGTPQSGKRKSAFGEHFDEKS